MTTEQMSPVQRSSSGSDSDSSWVENVPAQSIKSIQTFDGLWHNVKNCQFRFVGIGNSPAPGAYPTLKYTNEFGQTAYTSLKRILSYSTDPLSSSQQNQQQMQSQSNR